MSKKYTRQDIFNKFIKNRFASQHPKWILELPKQFVTHGYATEQNNEYTFTTLPTPNEVTGMLRTYGSILPRPEYEQRVKHIHTYLGIKIKRSFAIGLLIAFLLADVLFIGITIKIRRQTHESTTNSTRIDL